MPDLAKLSSSTSLLDELAETLMLGDLLELAKERCGELDLVAHWQQGEFHHDVIVRVSRRHFALGDENAASNCFLVVSTNCNGGVKEVIALRELPNREGLWKHRCEGATLHGVLGRSRTVHWFDPCELLGEDARSEMLPEFRRRQEGGGWEMITDGSRCGRSLFRVWVEPRCRADAGALPELERGRASVSRPLRDRVRRALCEA